MNGRRVKSVEKALVMKKLLSRDHGRMITDSGTLRPFFYQIDYSESFL